MGLKAAVQALKKAEELKARVSRHNDLLNNSEAWSDQQQLQTVYHQVLVLDLEYALDKKVEQELWTLGFKNHIAALQHLSRDKKNPRRSECQSLLSWCLEAASGFYLTLLQELCSAFELDLPFRRRGAVYGQPKTTWPNSEQLTQPHKSSCLYICQYCLVHLGDIARYRSQRKQAETFYRHAILLSPSSGQPYNQLALLEATRGDKLATVFHYVRSISVKHPFPAAATNLSNTLSAMIDNDEPLTEVHSKLTLPEFTNMFLRVHSLLHLATDLDQAELCVKSLNATFTALIATGAFSSMRLNQMTAINLYVLRHIVDSLSTNQLTSDELRVKHLVMDLLAGAFSAYLLPIYTMANDVTLLEYYALPAIKLTLDWIKTEPAVLSDAVFTKRLQIWPSLCKLLNALQHHVVDELDTKNCEKVPLPEDRDLQCFLPLVNAFKELDFTTENLTQDVLFFNKLRVKRLVNLGHWLATQNVVDHGVLVTAKKLKNPTRVIFEPANQQPDPTTELLAELKHFSVKESAEQIKKPSIKAVLAEKRGGILKPQGSLEKAREEREQQALLLSDNGDTVSTTPLTNSSTSSTRADTAKLKRTRQNVAMQALAKKVEENNKQVTFQTAEPIVKTAPPQKTSVVKQPLLEVPTKFNATKPDAVMSMMQQPNPLPLPIAVPSVELQANNAAAFQNHAYQNYPPRPVMNVGNVPFTVPYQNNNTSNLPPPPSFHGLPFNRQQQPHSGGFNMPTSVNQNQPVGYQPQSTVPAAAKEQFTSWMRDDKLPMPPTTWWTNNQKSLPRNFPPPPPAAAPAQSEMFSPNYSSYNMNSGFLPDGGLKSGNMDFNRQYSGGNTAGMYNNVSMWNSGPNIQQNLQMLLNQSSHHLTFGEGNKMSAMQRENNSLNTRDSNDNQNNAMPGYSLFNSNWAPNLTVHSVLKNSPPSQQSLFSGPGPSALERLLEQQKQLRGSKEDT